MGLEAFTYEEHPNREHKLAILIKETCMNKEEIYKYYVEPLLVKGLNLNDIAVYSLYYATGNKAPVKLIREYLTNTLIKAITKFNTQTILCVDPTYFKVLTGVKKPDMHFGYIEKGVHAGFETMDIILSVNYAALFYNPKLKEKIDTSLDTVIYSIQGIFIEPGSGIIHSESYPKTLSAIMSALDKLSTYDALTVDIETYSLQFQKTGIATISFAWDEHNFIAFSAEWFGRIQEVVLASEVYEELRKFFENYNGLLIYHGATFDIKIMINTLYMSHSHDTKGMLKGLEIMTKRIACTKIITYLATNSTVGNKLDLKTNAQEYTGNYAIEEIEDITKYELTEILKYNGIDTLATWYLYKKYYPVLKEEKQLRVYWEIMQPSIKTVIQMELTGMPMVADKVMQAEIKLSSIWDNHIAAISKYPMINLLNAELKLRNMLDRQAKLKKKVLVLDDLPNFEFNPGSSKQVVTFLHDQLGLPVIDKTKTGNPSVGGDTLKKHLNQLISKFQLTDKDLQ